MFHAVPDTRAWRNLVATAATVVVLAGCQRFNPAAISRQRHPELYGAIADEPRAQPAPEAPRRQPLPEPEPATIDLGGADGETVIVDATIESPQEMPSVDVGAALLAGTLLIDVNDLSIAPRLNAFFDGDTTTLSRTEDINPLVLRFRFEPPIRLRGARVFPSYSTYDWSLRPDPEGPRLMVQNAAEEQWSAIVLPEPVETAEVRLELRRLLRDNYVHLNEIVLLVDE